MEISCQIADVNHHANINVNTDVNINTSETACTASDMLTLIETRVYTPIATSVVQHIITNKNLKESARLFYLLADSKAHYNLYKNNTRSVKVSGNVWGELLNISEGTALELQKYLELQGYLQVERSKNNGKRNNVNKITPDLPETVFSTLSQEPNRKNVMDKPNKTTTCKRNYLDDSKLLVFFNHKQIELLIKTKNITPLQKLLWVYFYIRSYVAYKDYGDRAVPMTQKELAKLFDCTTSAISRALKNLTQYGYIRTKMILVEDDDNPTSNRCDKPLWFIEATFPTKEMGELFKVLKPRYGHYKEESKEVYQVVDNKYLNSGSWATLNHTEVGINESEASINQTLTVNNKNIILKTRNIKNNKTKLPVVVVDDVVLKKNIKPTLARPIQDLKPDNCNEVDILKAKHQANLQKLTPDQIRKATNFARKLKREQLCSPDLQDIAESELIRQFVHHAANFRMTKLDCPSRDAEIDAALNFAWNAATTGRWRCPVGWGIGFDIRLEREKYRYDDVNSKQVIAVNEKIKKYLDA